MSTQQLFYNTVVPVSNERHGNWHIRSSRDYSFTSRTNSVPVMSGEFPSACTEYPIVFAGNEEAVMPVILLGMHEEENAFVAEDGNWKGRYLPAFIRRYPFVFVQTDDKEKYALCIDESYDGFNQSGDGPALIGEDGKPSEYTNRMLQFLGNFQKEAQRTQSFCEKLKELNLLERKKMEVTMPDGSKVSLAGIYLIDRSRLSSLPADAIVDLVRSGAYELICLHLLSQRNFNHLIQLGGRQPSLEGDA